MSDEISTHPRVQAFREEEHYTEQNDHGTKYIGRTISDVVHERILGLQRDRIPPACPNESKHGQGPIVRQQQKLGRALGVVDEKCTSHEPPRLPCAMLCLAGPSFSGCCGDGLRGIWKHSFLARESREDLGDVITCTGRIKATSA